MNTQSADSHAEHANRFFFGTLFGLLAALGYAVTNVFLRSVADCDAVWVSAAKAAPLVVLAGPWLLVQFGCGRRPVLPDGRVLVTLVLAGLIGQLGGNVLFQWSLGVVGIAVGVPLCLGTLILSGALLGRFFLNEPVSLRTLVSVVVLVVAITVLSFGAGDAQRAVAETLGSAEPASWGHLAAGVVAAGLSGLAYSVLGVVIRFGVQGRASLPATLFIIGLVGVISLGGLTWWRIGGEGMWATSPRTRPGCCWPGCSTRPPFGSLTKALQVVNVVYVNAMNAAQVALAAVAGMVFFREALSWQLLAGIVLTVVGLMLMKRNP